MLRIVLSVAVLVGCRSPTSEIKPVKTSDPPAPAPAPAKPTRIDELFRSYEKKLPEPETLSEQNGASLKCEHHGWVTYTLLYAVSHKLAIESDAELLPLAEWARSKDVCLRQIALEAIMMRIKFDSNRISLPGMHEPEHHHFHDIFVALRSYLVANKVAFDPQLFAGMFLAVTPKDLAMMKGTWAEEATPGKGFLTTVEYDGSELRVTTKRSTPDPAWPDHTWTTKVAGVTVNDRGQLVVTGEWDLESNAKGYTGTKIVPSGFTYAFWPVRADLVWFDEGRGSWTKLRRVTK